MSSGLACPAAFHAHRALLLCRKAEKTNDSLLKLVEETDQKIDIHPLLNKAGSQRPCSLGWRTHSILSMPRFPGDASAAEQVGALAAGGAALDLHAPHQNARYPSECCTKDSLTLALLLPACWRAGTLFHYLNELFPALLKTLQDPEDQVVRLDLEGSPLISDWLWFSLFLVL